MLTLSSCKNKHYLMYIHQNYSYSMLRPIQQVILDNGGHVRWFLVGNEVDSKYLHIEEERLLTIKEVIDWQPDAVFVPGNVIPKFIPGIKVGVFHGFNSGKINRRGREDHFEIRGCFDLYCTQGPNTTEPFIELSKQYGHFDVVETGWANLDPLFQEPIKNPYIDNEDERPVLLFCSTFSNKYSCATKLIDNIKELRDSGRWRILVQFHPKMDQVTVEKYKLLQNESLVFVETDNIIPLLHASDIMLCDTSSVLLMFLLQRKPVVTFNNQKPLPHLINVTDRDDIIAALEFALSRPDEIMSNIEVYCQQLHPYQDGKSAERVLLATNQLIEKGTQHLKIKPFNLIREFKQRRQLRYWGF